MENLTIIDSGDDMKRMIKILLVLAAALLAIYMLLRWQGALLFWDEAAPGRYEVFGVDVSNYQGTVDWPALAEQGVDFAFLKATEGSSLVDKRFSANWENARSAGVLAGAYHFLSYDSPGETQADNFIATVPVTPGALPPVVDIEFYGDYIEHPKSAEEVRPILDALLVRLEAHYGQKPILYVTNESYRLYVAGRYGDYPLWCSFPILSPFWREWTFWQYSHHAILDGYDGAERYIDLNVFRGGLDELRAMTRPAYPGADNDGPRSAAEALPENTIQETFRPVPYIDSEVTVTVTYGGDNVHTVTISQGEEVVRTITEEDEDWLRSGWRHLTVEDMNFDGCLDFRFSYATFNQNYWEHVYLYDPYGTGQFYKAEELDQWCQLRFDQDSATVIARESSSVNARTTLIKWTGEGYAPRRRIEWSNTDGMYEKQIIVSERRPDAPRLLALKDPEDAWVPAARWETTGDADEELAPWLDPDYFGPEANPPAEIPQDLIDFLLPLAAADTWRPFARQFAAGKVMPAGEAERLWDETVGGDGVGCCYYVNGLRLDADNDGVEDMFLSDMQGSGHFNFFHLFSGGREATDEGLLGNFADPYFISWQGSRYLLVPAYGGDSRRFLGLDIYLFQEGKITRRAWLERETDSYRASDAWAAEGCESVLTDLEDRAAGVWSAFDETGEQPVGTAERLVSESESRYSCDWNNDGVAEEYRKFTSFSNACGRYLWLDEIDGKRLGGADPSQGEELQILWIDRRGDENLIYTAYSWGDQPIHMEVRRCAGGQTGLVAALTLEAGHSSRLAAYETDPQLGPG